MTGKVKSSNRGITENEAALILCVLGVPDPKHKGKKLYPSINEALTYMMTGYLNIKGDERCQEIPHVKKMSAEVKHEETIQLQLFV